jgi:SAM-dependent methyltransferase
MYMNHFDHWLTPPGIEILNTVRMKPGLKVLDAGTGSGHRIIELAQRLGHTSSVYGLEHQDEAVESMIQRCDSLHLDNIEVFIGEMEDLPFADGYFDLIISNNGFRNANSLDLALSEVYRVAKPSAQLIISIHLQDALKELYSVMLDVLVSQNMNEEAEGVKTRIHSRQKPLKEVEVTLNSAGFSIEGIKLNQFSMSFLDGTAFLNHYFIRNDVLDICRDLPEENETRQTILKLIEQSINEQSSNVGEYVVSIPYAVISCSRKNNNQKVALCPYGI